MSELKVNNISSVGSAIKINAPVGIKTAPPTTAGDSLYVSGNTDIEGSVEVVTVQAQNYGVRIKSPANNGTSILQFTNNSGTTERASIYADSQNGLNFSTAGTVKATINSTGLFTANGQSRFVGNATFDSPLVTVNQALDVNGKAIFDTVVPEIPTTLTTAINSPQHMVNKDYVDKFTYKPSLNNIYVAVRFFAANRTSAKTGGNYSTQIPSGTYTVLWFSDAAQETAGYENERDTYIGSGYAGVQTITITTANPTTFGSVADGICYKETPTMYGGYTAIFFKIT